VDKFEEIKKLHSMADTWPVESYCRPFLQWFARAAETLIRSDTMPEPGMVTDLETRIRAARETLDNLTGKVEALRLENQRAERVRDQLNREMAAIRERAGKIAEGCA
jgi:hypothetical protein